MRTKIMITENQIKIFIKYRGDWDYFSRCSKPEDSIVLRNEDWQLLLMLYDGLRILEEKPEICPVEFKDALFSRIKAESIDGKVFEDLIHLYDNCKPWTKRLLKKISIMLSRTKIP